MIFSARVSQIGSMNVANLALLKDFTPPLLERAKSVFRTFDEAYLKVRSDIDSTKIYSEQDQNNQTLMEINTATHATLRNIHRSSKVTGELYTIGMDRDETSASHTQGKRKVWSNLPSWARCFVEDKNGLISEITFKYSGESRPFDWIWKNWEVEELDQFLYITFFNQPLEMKSFIIDREENSIFAGRLGLLLDNPETIPPLKLKLTSEEW